MLGKRCDIFTIEKSAVKGRAEMCRDEHIFLRENYLGSERGGKGGVELPSPGEGFLGRKDVRNKSCL
ncbi:MAG: hypothetical protein MjAS7_1999 [Metallosphaera javensis (ex Sakai et al. 2022)]|nr:MAG: hypothetical protein MjAS7_1999 [Metallosphaera javensis (ex Sakai et al. 2022)]